MEIGAMKEMIYDFHPEDDDPQQKKLINKIKDIKYRFDAMGLSLQHANIIEIGSPRTRGRS